MYAVMGITGQVGASVADNLLTRGKQVRAIVRNPEKASAWKERGVELAVADYDDAFALESAFRNVEGIFVMIPPNFAPSPSFTEVRTTVAAIRAALDKVRPPRAVYLSSIGAQQTRGIGLITTLHIVEEQFGSLPIANAFLRAGWFMENSRWDVAPAREQGKLFSYLQPLDHTFALVSTQDIGRIAADTLLQNWTDNRYIEIAGPRRYSPRDLAAAFASALHREVEAVAVPREAWLENFIAQGMPEDRTAPRMEMLDAFNSGWIDFPAPDTEHIDGIVPLEKVITQLVAGT